MKHTREKKVGKPKKSESPRDFRTSFGDLSVDGEFLASSTGAKTKPELPLNIVESLGMNKRTGIIRKQDFIFYRYEGHVCISTPKKVQKINQAPVFRTETGEFNRAAFCSVLAIHDRE
jgi:hypothetical protein